MEKSLVFWKQFVTGLDQVHNVLEGFMNVGFAFDTLASLFLSSNSIAEGYFLGSSCESTLNASSLKFPAK